MTEATEKPRRGIRERLLGNPVVLKELRGRMRGPRAFVVLTLYLAMTSGFTVLLYVLQVEDITRTSIPTGSDIGRALFFGVVAIELFLVTFIGPAFTANAISGERERRTYELLRTTLLSAHALVAGKLLSALSYVVLLLFAAVPLQAIAFLFGGVTPQELVIAMVILMAAAFHFSTVGLYCSVVMKRTLPASVMTYGYAMVVTVGLPLLISLFLPLITSLGGLLDSTPVQAGLVYLIGLMVSTNPIATAVVSENLITQRQEAGFYWQHLSTGARIPVVSPWISFTVFAVVVSLALIGLSIRRIRQTDDE